MSSISQCYQEIARYNNLKAKLSSISGSLNSASSDISNLKNNIKSKYLIDDDPTAIVSKISQFDSEIKKTSSYLTGTICSSIDGEISRLEEEIRRLEEEERLRLAAMEEI